MAAGNSQDFELWNPVWQGSSTTLSTQIPSYQIMKSVQSNVMNVQPHMGEAKTAAINERRQRESFRKRKKTIFKNADAMGKRCKADIYIVVLRKGRWFTYTSSEKLGWPPTAESMANIYPLPIALTSADFESAERAQTGSEAGVSPAESPEEESRIMPSDPIEAMAEHPESQVSPRETTKRTFLIPRAPKVPMDLRMGD